MTLPLESVDPASLLPGTIDDLRSYVLAGGDLVVIASDNTAFLKELEPLLPVVFKEGTSQGAVRRSAVNQLTLDLELEGVVTRYLLVESKPGSITLLASGETPVLAFWQLGEGRAVYYGLRPEVTWGNFHLTPYFPIFWFNLVEYGKEAESNITPFFLEMEDGGVAGRLTRERKIEFEHVFLLLALAMIGAEVALLRSWGEGSRCP